MYTFTQRSGWGERGGGALGECAPLYACPPGGGGSHKGALFMKCFYMMWAGGKKLKFDI